MKPEVGLKSVQLKRISHLCQTYAQNKTQAFCLILSAVIFLFLTPLLRDGFKLEARVRQQAIDYIWPTFSDLYISLILYLILSRTRIAVSHRLSPLMRSLVKPKYTGKEREEKGDKAAKYVFKMSYFVVIVIVAYAILKDADYMPRSLLGSGDPMNTFVGHPYMQTTPAIKYYYMISLAYHFDSFMTLVLSEPKKDFGQMFLHHFLTLCLIVFSYVSNYIRVGSLVMFVHDLGEIPAGYTKIFVDLKGHSAIIIVGVTWLMFTWFYSRCYVFPKDIIYTGSYLATRDTVAPEFLNGISIFITFLSALVVLHYYWFWLFVKMVMHYVKKGEAVDLQANNPQEKQKKN